MKVSVDVESITLFVNGRDMTFSEEELRKIIEIHFKKDGTVTETNETENKKIEGLRFNVDPNSINWKLFEEKRTDDEQEKTRQMIINAFHEMNRYPKQYKKTFKTILPAKTFDAKNVKEIKAMANGVGDHIADWVEQALELAQRISNGESWEDICNKPDDAPFFRWIKWINNGGVLIGGVSGKWRGYSFSASKITYYRFAYHLFKVAVPLVVSYD